MLLQYESEDPLAVEDERAGAWLRPETLEALAELNELSLALLAEQASVRSPAAGLLVRQVGELWRALDPAARRRAAACPYLLLDAGFADAPRWRRAAALGVGDAAPACYHGFFSVPGAAELASLLFTYAWYLARVQRAAARLLLGMSAPCAALIGGYSLPQIRALAAKHPGWLRPRWPARVEVWRELLLSAAAGETQALERARLRGITLLAAEARAGTRPGA
jgi:hypothetical protein